MKIIDCQQGTNEWRMCRLGIPTASQMHRILTPKTLKPSAQSEKYISELVAERLTGTLVDDGSSGYMEYGKRLEDEARAWYAFQFDNDVTQVGFCLHDEWQVGCSPDGLVGEDGGLEIKCPGAAQHVDNVRHGMMDHRLQVQASLWITGRKWWDIVSYNSSMDPVCFRMIPDMECIKAIESAMVDFVRRLDAAEQRARSHD